MGTNLVMQLDRNRPFFELEVVDETQQQAMRHGGGVLRLVARLQQDLQGGGKARTPHQEIEVLHQPAVAVAVVLLREVKSFEQHELLAGRLETVRDVAQSAQHAIPQGLCVGHNVVADLFGGDLTELQTLPYGTCLDLGEAGAVYTEGWERQVVLVGDDAKALKRAINEEWIYPPIA